MLLFDSCLRTIFGQNLVTQLSPPCAGFLFMGGWRLPPWAVVSFAGWRFVLFHFQSLGIRDNAQQRLGSRPMFSGEIAEIFEIVD